MKDTCRKHPKTPEEATKAPCTRSIAAHLRSLASLTSECRRGHGIMDFSMMRLQELLQLLRRLILFPLRSGGQSATNACVLVHTSERVTHPPFGWCLQVGGDGVRKKINPNQPEPCQALVGVEYESVHQGRKRISSANAYLFFKSRLQCPNHVEQPKTERISGP